MDKVSASKIVGLRVAKAKARAKGFGGSKKGDGDSQLDLFEAEGGRRYSRQYVRSNEEELRRKRKGGGKGVLVKGKNFASRSEAGRYAANMRWRGHSAGLKDSVARDYKTYDELSPDQKKKVSSDAKRMGRETGLNYSPEAYYKENAGSYDIRSGVKNPTNYDAKQESAGPDTMSGGVRTKWNLVSDFNQLQAKNSKGQIVVTEKNLSAPLPAEDAKNYTKDRKTALNAFDDVKNHISALEPAINALSNKEYLKLQYHVDRLQEDVTSWKSAFDDAGDAPTVKGAIKMTAAVGLGETIKYHMRNVHEKTGWTGAKLEGRASEFEFALQSAADKRFGVSPKKYDISDAIYRDIEQEDWA